MLAPELEWGHGAGSLTYIWGAEVRLTPNRVGIGQCMFWCHCWRTAEHNISVMTFVGVVTHASESRFRLVLGDT